MDSLVYIVTVTLQLLLNDKYKFESLQKDESKKK